MLHSLVVLRVYLDFYIFTRKKKNMLGINNNVV